MLKKNKLDSQFQADSIETEIDINKTNENENVKKQPILPFTKQKDNIIQNNNFKLPLINFLEKNINIKSKKNLEDSDLAKNSEFLEKILLDFGVEGKIKRISCGPVVTLNEFEPASGVKVSKIVNLPSAGKKGL